MPLNINGVEVSVYPDALALAQVRGDDRVGQVFIRCTIGQGGDAAENRRGASTFHPPSPRHHIRHPTR